MSVKANIPQTSAVGEEILDIFAFILILNVEGEKACWKLACFRQPTYLSQAKPLPILVGPFYLVAFLF